MDLFLGTGEYSPEEVATPPDQMLEALEGAASGGSRSVRCLPPSDSLFRKCVVCSEITGSSLQRSFLLANDSSHADQLGANVSMHDFLFKSTLQLGPREDAAESDVILCSECCSALQTASDLQQNITTSQIKLAKLQLYLRRRFHERQAFQAVGSPTSPPPTGAERDMCPTFEESSPLEPLFETDILIPSSLPDSSTKACFAPGLTPPGEIWSDKATPWEEHAAKDEWSDSVDDALFHSASLCSDDSFDLFGDDESPVATAPKCGSTSPNIPQSTEKIGIPAPELSPSLPSHANLFGGQVLLGTKAGGPIHTGGSAGEPAEAPKGVPPQPTQWSVMIGPPVHLLSNLTAPGVATGHKLESSRETGSVTTTVAGTEAWGQTKVQYVKSVLEMGGVLNEQSPGSMLLTSNGSAVLPLPSSGGAPVRTLTVHTINSFLQALKGGQTAEGKKPETKNYVDIKSHLGKDTSRASQTPSLLNFGGVHLINTSSASTGNKLYYVQPASGGGAPPVSHGASFPKVSYPPGSFLITLPSSTFSPNLLSVLQQQTEGGATSATVAPTPGTQYSGGHMDVDEIVEIECEPRAKSPQASVGASAGAEMEPRDALEPVENPRVERGEADGAAAPTNVDVANESSLRCRICPRAFRREDDAGICGHIERHNRLRPLLCPFCEYEPATMADLLEHTRASHTLGGNVIRCPSCGIVCGTEYGRKMHASKHAFFANCWQKEGLFSCAWCSTKFEHKELLLRHWTTRHKKDVSEEDVCLYFESVTCPTCSKDFTSLQQLAAHDATVHRAQLWACPFDSCNSQYERVEHLISHVRCSHNAEEVCLVRCQLCSVQLTDWSNLKAHVNLLHNNVPTLAPPPNAGVAAESGHAQAPAKGRRGRRPAKYPSPKRAKR